jgi:hypothetical protein
MKKVYRHFKGGFYIKHFDATDTETGVLMTVYENENGEFFTRPKHMFDGYVKRDGYEGPRFQLLH